MKEDLIQALSVDADELNGEHAIHQLSTESRELLLKWYNEPRIKSLDEVVREALCVLRWCTENSGLFLYPFQMRQAALISAAQEFDMPRDRLCELMVNSDVFVEHSPR